MKTNIINFFSNFLMSILTYLIAFFSPIKFVIVAVGFIVMFDFILGILNSYKNKKPIKSNKMFRTIPKFIAYTIGVICAQIIALLFEIELPVVNMIAGFIAYIELKSIDEKIKGITGHSIFGAIIEKLNPKKKEL